MARDERAARCEVLAHQVRRAVIELTSEQRRRMTSIQEVARRLGVTDSNLLLEALEFAIRLGWMRVASGVITVSDSVWRADSEDLRRRALNDRAAPACAAQSRGARVWRARNGRRASLLRAVSR
jgi:hypothetical protein